MNVFPTFASLRDVVDYTYSKIPISNPNDAFALLMTYHNTLLATQNKDT